MHLYICIFPPEKLCCYSVISNGFSDTCTLPKHTQTSIHIHPLQNLENNREFIAKMTP